jgi:hypothetical protein
MTPAQCADILSAVAALPDLPDLGCVEVMGEIMELAKARGLEARILWIESVHGQGHGIHPACGGPAWKYHCVPVIAGRVIDVWNPAAIVDPECYAAAVFPGQPVTLEYIESETP